MTMPLISVIVPVYNAEDYLAECLDSIVNQTFSDIEIICVNDGSTDKSLVILEEYALKDARITVLSQANQKQGAARNAGLKIAKGTYISFIDSDDLLDLQTYECLLPQLGKVDVVAFAAQSFLSGDSEKCFSYFKSNYKAPFVGKKTLTDAIRGGITVSVCMKIFTKELIDTNTIAFPCGLRYEDNAFTFNYLAVSQTIYYYEQQFYKRRVREDSTMGKTHSKQSSTIDILHVYRDIYSFLVKHDLFNKNEHLFAEKLKDIIDFAYKYSLKKEKDAILELYKQYITEFFANSALYTSCMDYAEKVRVQYSFSPQKYYTYKVLSFITFGKTSEHFSRKCQFQKSMKD